MSRNNVILSLAAVFLEQEADHTSKNKFKIFGSLSEKDLSYLISHETCMLMSRFVEVREPLEVSGRILISVGLL